MARRFTFRLQALLDLRKRREDEQKKTLAQCLLALQHCERRVEDLERQRHEAARRIRDARSTPVIDVAAELRERRWCEGLADRISHARREVRNRIALAEQARRALALRSTERKAIELLREKRLREFHAEQQRRETVEHDEVAAQAWLRQARSDGAEPSRLQEVS